MSTQHNYKRSAGIPGIRNVDHIALTVPDLDQAVKFFVEVLGWEYIYKMGPTEDPNGTWMKDRLNVDPKASLNFIMLRAGPHLNIEVYQYSAPDQRQVLPKNSDWGGFHMCFFVNDIQAAYDYLKAQPGVTMLGEPELVDSGPTAGDWWVYFLTPWGMQMEITSYPAVQPFHEETKARYYGADRWEGDWQV